MRIGIWPRRSPAPPREAVPGAPRRGLGMLIFGSVVAAVAFAISAGTVLSLNWMETPEFCGSCHTMKPELRAYELSPHKAVECAECHIGPAPTDLISAKMQGMIQLMHLVSNTYPRPIPPAAHGMVKGQESCGRCHKEAPTGRDRLDTRTYFAQDATNTPTEVALVVKLADVAPGRDRGIHWHVKSNVELLGKDVTARAIDYVRVQAPDGTVTEYASTSLIKADESSDAIAEARGSEHLQRMTCLSCHNRVGHEFLSPERAVDDALATGRIDRTLPYIKKQSLQLLAVTYGSTDEAAAGIGQLADYYHENYPEVYSEKLKQITAAEEQLEELYGIVASPEMAASYQNYPNYLGHKDNAGCFRCHDGGHFKLDDKSRPTRET
ncbi:MAG: NapC/NirT family cytochrome c, partial [Chloroflexi bacterium]|nr:NapC/NirT family cytochrome c [Chloroflexota bacterium]